MATIRKIIEINLSAPAIWDAVRDVGNLHIRLAPGLVADCLLNDDGSERTVTFGDGTILPEKIISIDDDAMRFVWSAQNPSLAHHNGAMEVSAINGERSSVSWTADILPHHVADYMAPFIDAGLATMKAHLESGSSSSPKVD